MQFVPQDFPLTVSPSQVFLQLTREDMEPEVNSLRSVSESVLVNDMFASRDSVPDDLNSMYLGEKASKWPFKTVPFFLN